MAPVIGQVTLRCKALMTIGTDKRSGCHGEVYIVCSFVRAVGYSRRCAMQCNEFVTPRGYVTKRQSFEYLLHLE